MLALVTHSMIAPSLKLCLDTDHIIELIKGTGL